MLRMSHAERVQMIQKLLTYQTWSMPEDMLYFKVAILDILKQNIDCKINLINTLKVVHNMSSHRPPSNTLVDQLYYAPVPMLRVILQQTYHTQFMAKLHTDYQTIDWFFTDEPYTIVEECTACPKYMAAYTAFQQPMLSIQRTLHQAMLRSTTLQEWANKRQVACEIIQTINAKWRWSNEEQQEISKYSDYKLFLPLLKESWPSSLQTMKDLYQNNFKHPEG
jgi:hypothetical protein